MLEHFRLPLGDDEEPRKGASVTNLCKRVADLVDQRVVGVGHATGYNIS
jgi:hypothetical protein